MHITPNNKCIMNYMQDPMPAEEDLRSQEEKCSKGQPLAKKGHMQPPVKQLPVKQPPVKSLEEHLIPITPVPQPSLTIEVRTYFMCVDMAYTLQIFPLC